LFNLDEINLTRLNTAFLCDFCRNSTYNHEIILFKQVEIAWIMTNSRVILPILAMKL
jgi:hypothetical protein